MFGVHGIPFNLLLKFCEFIFYLSQIIHYEQGISNLQKNKQKNQNTKTKQLI